MTEETPLEEQCRELVEEWRNQKGVDGRTASIFELCADELEAILDE